MKALKQIRNGLAYMTILPLSPAERLTDEEFGRLPAWYPLAGLALGLMLWLFLLALRLAGAPPAVSAVMAVGLLAALTRGFHLDGLADAMDALLSHRSREEILAIMKDPHQGTFGVLSIALDAMLKAALIFSALQRPDWFAPIILFPVWGRLSSSTVSAFSRYARASGGLAWASVEHSSFREFAGAFASTLAISLLFGPQAFITALCAFLASIALVWVWDKALSGVTGDLLGAGCEMTELFSLFVFVVFF